MHKHMAVAVVLWPLFSATLAAQPIDGWHWRSYTSRDGLAESWVGHVTRGPTGRLWISHGTADGLTVFDGYAMRTAVSPGPRLRVVEGWGGEAWASVWGERELSVRGVQHFDGQAWKSAWIAEAGDLALGYEGQIVALAEGRALVLTPTALLEIDARSGTARISRDAGDTALGRFISLLPARGGGVWLTGSRGVGRLAAQGRWTETPLGPDLFDLRAPQEGPGGDLWGVATWRGEGNAPKEPRAVVRLAGDRFLTVARSQGQPVLAGGWPGPDGGYWLLWTNLDGARLSYVRDGVTREAPANKLLSRMVKEVLVDPDGGFWMATGLGLARMSPASWREPPGLPVHDGHFGSILADESGNLFVLHESGLFVGHDGRWTHHVLPRRNLWMNISQGLVRLGDGRVAVQASAPGPLFYDPGAQTFEPAPFDSKRWAIALQAARGGGLWVASMSDANDYRIDRWDGASVRTVVSSQALAPLGEIRGLLETADGALWVAAISGKIGRFDDGRLQVLGPEEGYFGGGAFSLLELETGRLWLGERTAIREFDGRGFTLVRDGLETVRSMLRARDGAVWVASGDGLHRFKGGSWLDLGVEEGLPDASIQEVYETAEGRIWVGSTNGLRVQHPEADRDPPRTELPGRAPGGEVAPRGEVQIVFGGRDRWDATPADALLFSHRVDDGDWSPFQSEPGALMRGLRPGDHRVEVSSMDRAGNVDPQGASLSLRVLLPWYREPAVAGLSMLAVAALALFAGSLVHRYATLDRLVRSRTAALDEANREVRHSEERLRLVIDAVPELVAWKGKDGRYQGANRAFARAVGRGRPEEIVGLQERDVVPVAEEAEAMAAAGLAVMESGVPETGRLQAVRLDSGIRALEVTRVPLHDADGQVVGLLFTATDVTARQEAERERERLEVALQQAQRLEAIGKLAGGIAHDFNNVLTVISGHTALLARRTGPDGTGGRDLARIAEAADRATALTRQLLAFSRGQVMQPRVLDLNAVVANILPMLARLIGEDIELVTHLAPGLRNVTADPAKLDQVVMNLVVNARDAMPSGGRLLIETANVELADASPHHHPGIQAGRYVVLVVTDSGSGMSAEVLERAFEPFFTTKPAGQGTGLGLATVYGIVKQSGGDVWVYSEKGLGTTVKVYLPATDSVADGLAPASEPAPAATGPATILLTEDEPALRDLVTETLEEAGYTVIAASDAEEALRRAGSHPEPIDLLLTDVVMPGMSGPLLARRLQELRPEILVIFMSGYTANTLGQQGVSDTEVLEKPFSPGALVAKIEAVLGARPPDR
jgi:two-component system, cell cycle sensor histidine kinase and response regulator CckA